MASNTGGVVIWYQVGMANHLVAHALLGEQSRRDFIGMEGIPLMLWSVLCKPDGIDQNVGLHCGNGQQASKVGHK